MYKTADYFLILENFISYLFSVIYIFDEYPKVLRFSKFLVTFLFAKLLIHKILINDVINQKLVIFSGKKRMLNCILLLTFVIMTVFCSK